MTEMGNGEEQQQTRAWPNVGKTLLAGGKCFKKFKASVFPQDFVYKCALIMFGRPLMTLFDI